VGYFREKLRLGLALSGTQTSGEVVQRGVG
jgi:hypothetical protein